MTKFDLLAEQFLLELQYHEIGHDIGDFIFLYNGGKLHTFVNKGTIGDFHFRYFPDIDHEDYWHGRCGRNGYCIVLPPHKEYVKGRYDIATEVEKAIVKKFHPKAIYLETMDKGAIKVT